MPDQQPPLRIRAAHQSDAYVICIEGELDLGGCPELDRALEQAEQTRADRIIVDLEQLTFIDSGGVGTLVEASRRSASNGNRLELTRGRGHPAKILRLLELDQVLPLTDPSLCPAIRSPATPSSKQSPPREIRKAEGGEPSAL